jgi:ribosomal protein S18 acetylase RimI-like enzyme
MSALIVRDAARADLEQAAALGAEIVRLHHATNPKRFFMLDDAKDGYHWWLSQEIERPEAVILVAELEGNIVGYAYGAIEDRDWSILVDRHGAFHDLCVAESVRRKGIGRALVKAMLDRLEQLGAPRILARTMVQNAGAQRLIQEFGFVPTMTESTREHS